MKDETFYARKQNAALVFISVVDSCDGRGLEQQEYALGASPFGSRASPFGTCSREVGTGPGTLGANSGTLGALTSFLHAFTRTIDPRAASRLHPFPVAHVYSAEQCRNAWGSRTQLHPGFAVGGECRSSAQLLE